MEKWVGAQELGFEGRGHPVSAVGMEQRLEELRAGAHRVVTGQLSCSKEVARGEGMWSPEGPLPPPPGHSREVSGVCRSQGCEQRTPI